MRRQVTSTVAITLCVLLAAMPAQAGTVHILDVLQGAAHGRAKAAHSPRLRAVSQTGSDVASGVTPSAQDGQTQAGTTAQGGSDTPSASGDAPVSLISQEAQSSGGGQVETVDLGDVTGTVCDCGEFENPVIRGGGFPLWPLAGLGAIPFLFIKRDNPPPPGNPPSTPPPPAVPEPATLLLLGSGLLALGAGARRRRRQQFGEEAAKAEVI